VSFGKLFSPCATGRKEGKGNKNTVFLHVLYLFIDSFAKMQQKMLNGNPHLLGL